jgi:hypothetical protein
MLLRWGRIRRMLMGTYYRANGGYVLIDASVFVSSHCSPKACRGFDTLVSLPLQTKPADYESTCRAVTCADTGNGRPRPGRAAGSSPSRGRGRRLGRQRCWREPAAWLPAPFPPGRRSRVLPGCAGSGRLGGREVAGCGALRTQQQLVVGEVSPGGQLPVLGRTAGSSRSVIRCADSDSGAKASSLRIADAVLGFRCRLHGCPESSARL